MLNESNLGVRQKQAETVRTHSVHRKEAWELGKVPSRPLDSRDHPQLQPQPGTLKPTAGARGAAQGGEDPRRARVSLHFDHRKNSDFLPHVHANPISGRMIKITEKNLRSLWVSFYNVNKEFPAPR